MAGVVDEERGHEQRGAPTWGDGRRRGRWRGTNGDASRGCTGVDVEEEERGAGNGGVGAVDGCVGAVVPVGMGWCSGGVGGGVGAGLK